MRGHLRARFAAFLVALAVIFSGGITAATSASAATAGYCYGTYLTGNQYVSCNKAATNTFKGAWAPRTGRGIVNELNTYCYQQKLYGFWTAWDNAKKRLGTNLGNSVYAAHSPMC